MVKYYIFHEIFIKLFFIPKRYYNRNSELFIGIKDYTNHINFYFYWTLNKTKRLIVAVVGLTVLLLGIALIFLTGPAFIVIPIGLAILAT